VSTSTRSRALLAGTLAVGILDITDAFIFFWLRSGVRPTRILQSIAAGLLGRETAVAGGLATAMLGLGLHFFIAFMIVLTYHLASRRLRALVTRPVIFGVLYVVAVYAVMNFIVLPLSAAPPRAAPAGAVLVNGVLIHIFGVGLPAALTAAWAHWGRG
jgi:hypothetical protein